MPNTLLPPNATPLMQRIENACQQATTLPIPLRQLWNTQTCPVYLLPYLAWAMSVDRWDPAWSDEVKRAAIEQAHFIHQHKGTIAAIRRAVEPLGYLIRVTEWWQDGQAPGTFTLDIGVQNNGITEEMYQELERVIDSAKPVSRHLTKLSIHLDVSCRAPVAATSYDGDTLTIYPYTPETINVVAKAYSASAVHLIDTMGVNS